MSYIRRTLVLAVSLLPLSATAFPIKECRGNSVMAHHIFEEDHRAIGAGIVAYDVVGSMCFDSACTSMSRMFVSACASGKTLVVQTKWKKDGWDDSFDRTEQADKFLTELVNSDERFSLAEVKREFEAKGFVASMIAQTEENCACAKAFPKQRNGKKKFKGS